ncbi:MAG: LuxR C-terminal-related transcriptional regulator, partial [Proteobacteria bacterium]|nr:LuxR C-terminal-related transcriptional regulator [Pseudomonadota bacterium]
AKSLSLAEPEGYLRVYLDEGQPLKELLSDWEAESSESSLHDYARRILTEFENQNVTSTTKLPTHQTSISLIEPLSPRETEVLQQIATGKTNQEIARHLYVSPGTIKAHTSSIYRKLEVANRTESVARARELQILS